jgi:hypothetical protein
LNAGIVKFWYTKKDGSRREAIGTRNPEILDTLGGTPKGEREDRKEANPLIYCYYDFGKAAWRCFRTDLFGGLLFEHLTNEQAAAEVLKSGREEGDDEIAKCVATKLVGSTMAAKMFSDLLNDFSVSEIVERAVAPSSPKGCMPSSAPAPTPIHHVSLDDRNELIAELLSIRERESEILRVLLQ